MKPFQQRPFSSLPDRPRIPHPWFETTAREIVVTTSGFGAVRTHLRVSGEGPPLLLVHGLMTTSYSWRYAMPLLGEHFTCYAPDLVGSGRSDQPDAPYTPANQVAYLDALVTELGIRGCPVLGNSMGGYLCMRWALAHPDAMSRLLNLHSPGIPIPRIWALKAALSLPGSFRLLRWLIHRDPLRWAHSNVHYYDESLKSLEEAREYATPLETAEGARAFGRILYETMDPSELWSFAAQLKSRRDDGLDFPVPLQLVYAEEDPMVPPAVGRAMEAMLPGSSTVWMTEASHFAHVDASERFAEIALPFLLG